jgi:hypothetical protein
MNNIMTEPVNIDGVSTTTRRPVYVRIPDPPVRLLGQQDVTVTVAIVSEDIK